MGGVAPARRFVRWIAVGIAFVLHAPIAQGFEAFDGRLQVHGFFESQLRLLNEDFSEQWDVAQWYQVLNVELELDIIQDSIGPIDLMSAYVRVEGRFDCALYHGCGVFRSINTYGDQSKQLPRRLSNAEERVFAGELFIRNDGLFSPNRDPVGFEAVQGFAGLTETDGQTNIVALNPDPGNLPNEVMECTPGEPTPAGTTCYVGIKPFDYVFERDAGFRFTQIANGVGGGGNGHPNQILGPWLPKNVIGVTNARFVDRVNPFDGDSITPVLLNDRIGVDEPTGSTGVGGAGSRPFRPIPIFPAENPNGGFDLTDNPLDDIYFGLASQGLSKAPLRNREDLDRASWNALATRNSQARGLFVPSEPLRALMDSNALDSFDYDFTNLERAFNRGASQQDEGELKEAYLDVELFDSRLWLRLGKQNIVWGKTELFRTTDQFNPTDLALASLPSLEEARIALWAARGVYSLYEVGPLQDVRLEVAVNLDDIEPVDLGACGEAFTFNLVCSLSLGGYAHGFTGFGIAGVDRPPSIWRDADGIEVGGRIEFRWDRFSFAISDFYGYDDFPHLQRINDYQRNVDPFSGRGRAIGARGKCDGDLAARFGDLPLGMWGTGPNAEFLADPLTRGGTRNNGIMDPDCIRPGSTDRSLLGGAEAALYAVTRTNDTYRANPVHPSFSVSAFGTSGYDTSDVNYDPRMDSSCTRTGVTLPPHCFNPLHSAAPRPGADEYIENPDGTAKYRFYDNNSLDRSPANLTLFSWLCSTTIGFIDSDRRACAQTIFGSRKQISGIPIARLIGQMLAGDKEINGLVTRDTDGDGAFLPLSMPTVRLSIEGSVPADSVHDENSQIDYRTLRCVDPTGVDCGGRFDLSTHLTSSQEALLGCGPFWGTNCDNSGLDLLNAEASAIYQSFSGATGTTEALADFDRRVRESELSPWLTTDQGYRADGYAKPIRQAQEAWAVATGNFLRDAPLLDLALVPGTLRWQLEFPGGRSDPICSTEDLGEVAGRTKVRDPYLGVHQLPGCRRKWNDVDRTVLNPQWNVYEDGDPDTLGVQGTDAEQLYFPRAPTNLFGYLPPGTRPTGNGATGYTEATAAVFVSETEVCIQCDQNGEFFGDPRVLRAGNHPFTNDPFSNEMAGVSWNFHMVTVAFSGDFQDTLDIVGELSDPGQRCALSSASDKSERCRRAIFNYAYSGADVSDLEVPLFVNGSPNPVLPFIPGQGSTPGVKNTVAYGEELEEFVADLHNAGLLTVEDPEGVTLGKNHCSFVTPQNCELVQNLYAISGQKRNVLEAGGNGVYGRRTFWWHSGGEVVVRHDRRNVLGFSVDFAEDRSKSNWGVEFTWIGDVPNANNNSSSGLSFTDDFNLTVSVDRPTFINFLNPNRTFFFNSQWFFQYKKGYQNGFTGNGPLNVLATFTVFTGYFQDRLNPSLTIVGDLKSGSGAVLPQIGYRFSENFSASVGINMFWGREQLVDMPINEIAPAQNRSGPNAYRDGVSNLLSLIRDRDEVYARIRYTF